MNAITREIKRLAPDYVMSDYQLREAAKAKDPEANAATFESRIAELRRQMIDVLDVPDEVIEIGDLIELLELEHYVKSYGVLNDAYLLGGMTKQRVLEMGKAAGALQVDALTAIYREVLGREPDPEGLAFWRGHYEDGMPLSEVIRYIEDSPEAQHASPSG